MFIKERLRKRRRFLAGKCEHRADLEIVATLHHQAQMGTESRLEEPEPEPTTTTATTAGGGGGGGGGGGAAAPSAAAPQEGGGFMFLPKGVEGESGGGAKGPMSFIPKQVRK
jgi:hypothetical protein